jgi:Tol biopolymer transport system component
MKKWSALNILGALVLGAAVIAFAVLIVLRPMLQGQQVDVTAEVSGTDEGETAEAPDISATPPQPVAGRARIAFVSDRDGNMEIYTMNPDGSDVLRLTENNNTDMTPQWSPDGSKIAFFSDRDGFPPQYYVMNADGSDPVKLTFSDEPILGMNWSPDSSQIAYLAGDPQGTRRLFITTLMNNSGVIELWKGDLSEIQWSPSGEWIAFTSSDASQGALITSVQLINIDSSEVVRINEEGLPAEHPAWSPDGQQLVFVSIDPTTLLSNLYIADMTGEAPPVQITHEQLQIRGLTWSPDGQHIAFYADDTEGITRLYIVTPDGDTIIEYLEVSDPGDLNWSPDSGYIAMQAKHDDRLYVSTVDVDTFAYFLLTDADSNNMMPDWQPIGMTYTDAVYTPTPTIDRTQITDDLLDDGMATLTAIASDAATATPTPLPTLDSNATPIESFAVLEQQMWPAPDEAVDWSQPLSFGQYIRFATPSEVHVYLIAFPIFADEELPTPNYCYASNGAMPSDKHADRPFWSEGFPHLYPAGEHEFEHVYGYAEPIEDATHLISWLVIRDMEDVVIHCSQQVIDLLKEL